MSAPGLQDSSALAPAATPGSPPAPSLKQLATRASLWTLGGEGTSHVLRLVSNLILTRLLYPEAFGLMALLGACITGLRMFSDVGIRPSVIQHARGDDPVFLNTAWTLQVIRGAGLWICSCIIAWPLAGFYGEPSLSLLLPVLGLDCLIAGFHSTKIFTCDRHMSLARTTLLNLGTYILGIAVMINWSWFYPSVWALVGGGLATTLSKGVLSHLLLPGVNNRFLWDRKARGELLRFGKWVFLSTLLTFFAMQADRLIFAKMIPLGLLGVYSIGSMIARLPMTAVEKLSSAVALPAFSRMRNQSGGFQSLFDSARRKLLTAGGASLSLLVLFGPLAISLMYDDRYHDAGWIIQIVAAGAWFQVLELPNGVAILSMGQPKWLAAGSSIKIVSMAILIPLAYLWLGFLGALIAIALVEVPRYLISALRARAVGLQGWGIEIVSTAGMALCCLIAFALENWIPETVGTLRRVGIASAGYLLIWLPLGLNALRGGKAVAA